MNTADKRRKANRKAKRAKLAQGTIKGEPIVIKFAAAEDEATGDGYEIYTLLRSTGDRVSIEVPRDIACEPTQLRKALNKKASLLPREKNKALPMIQAAVQQPPLETWLYVRHVGWRPDMRNSCYREWGHRRQLRRSEIDAASIVDLRSAALIAQEGIGVEVVGGRPAGEGTNYRRVRA